jgi:hypothetical protein
MIEKSLDRRLQNILADPSCGEFILADAKDADMAAGLVAPGQSPPIDGTTPRLRSLQEYREQIRANIEQGLVDIMLMSASTSEVVAISERLFDESQITPAVRVNDTTDIWLARGSQYVRQPSLPFRSATLDHAMYGQIRGEVDQPVVGADLGLYSMTFNNDAERDRETLEHYGAFRREAETKGFRHFLEVFDPNALQAPVADVGRFVADNIARTLAGVVGKGRPLFLKIAYHGPAILEQLVSYDHSLVVGILGGASGTTFDAFHQLYEARKYGARAALYGRMINNSEHQLSFIQHLRYLADGDIDDPVEAVRSYHDALSKYSIVPFRDLDEDSKPQ